jgi:hypothetical protein
MFRVVCDACGREAGVTAGQAGGDVACACGGRVRVPSLSRLREAAGGRAYESGPLDEVRRRIAEGELPGGSTCLVCGLPTTDVLTVELELERTSGREPPRGVLFLMAMLVSPWILAVANRDAGPPVGRETRLRVPLRVRREHHRRLGRRSARRALRRLLEEQPAYAGLLRAYPRATYRVVEESGT